MYLAIRTIFAIGVFVSVCASPAWANTATIVFEAAAPSIVVVQVKDAKGKTEGQGSGVVIGKEEIVTNCHVIENAASYSVKHQERQFMARLKHADWTRDICSLTVKGLDARVAPLGSTKRLKVGQKVFAIGAPQGLELTLSEGILSSLRELDDGRYLQISAPISPGSSGGGLFDEDGRLIGLPTFYLSEGQQLNFAVPVEWVQALPQRAEMSKPAGSTSVNWLANALALEAKQDWPGLVKHASEWTHAQHGHSLPWIYLGIAHNKAGLPTKAIEAFQQALRINPEYAATWFNIGVAYSKSGQRAKAIQAYQQALRIDPDDAHAWRNLGITYTKEGQSDKAIEAFQQALRINPDYIEAWLNIGTAYSKVGQPTKAIEAFQHASSINPENADAWRNLGITYTKEGQSDKAIEAFQQVLRIDPDDVAAWYNFGIIYSVVGPRGKVLEVYKRLKTLDPASAEHFFKTFVLP